MKSKHYIVLLIWLFISAGCRLIDDDLSVCGTESDYLINYQVRLVTEVHMAIDEKLSLDIEKPIADALKVWSDTIFSGHAHDLDMYFYSLDGTNELKHQFEEIINASQKSYTLTIPRQDYQHLAVVNMLDNKNVTMMGEQYSNLMHVEQRPLDTLPSHPTAIYTARLPMHMNDSVDQSFNVNLYMISCAVALVITQPITPIPPMRVVLSGTATGFNVRDSVFTFSHPSLIRPERVMDRCYAMVALPSRDTVASGMMPIKRQTASSALWELKTYVTLPDGKVTETILSADTPLKAGTLEVVKVQLNDDGSLTPIQTTHIGASVTLDWKEGGTHEVITG